jgi:hypothetical protein
MGKQRKVGRPPLFVGAIRQQIVNVIRKVGGNIGEAERVLKARNGVVGITTIEREQAEVRRSLNIADPISISYPWLRKIAKEAKLKTRKPGRPSFAEAA